MKVIEARNVNDALSKGLRYLLEHGVEEPSRNGPVLVAPGPVTTVYSHSRERVLFCPLRDANPFLHLMESLWMLAGRDDVEFPAYFAANMRNYSDDGKTLHGAYGRRWRSWFGYDQLQIVAEELRRNPASRRCVLTMWDAGGQNGDLHVAIRGGLDVPCNTHAYVDARGGRLNLTVLCRSNDVIWGAYGTNAVHFSVLQEVLAAMVGVEVGIYLQVSNNYHAYTETFSVQKLAMLAAKSARFNYYDLNYPHEFQVEAYPIVCNPEWFFKDLEQFMKSPLEPFQYVNPFFWKIAIPMYTAWHERKEKQSNGLQWVKCIVAPDWRLACQQWIERREQKKLAAKEVE